MVAHAEEYLYTVFFPPDYSGQDAPKPEQIASAIDFTKRTGAFVTADLNTYATIARQWGKPEIVDDFLRQPEVRYLDPDDRIAWKNSPYVRKSGDLNARLEVQRQLRKYLNTSFQEGATTLPELFSFESRILLARRKLGECAEWIVAFL